MELWKNTQALEQGDEESTEISPTKLYWIYVNCTFIIDSLFLKLPTRASQTTQQIDKVQLALQNHMVEGENQ